HGRVVSRVETSVKHRPERPGDLLTVLDDRILMPAPFHELLSFGDLILAVGLVDVCFWASRRDEDAWESVFAAPYAPARRTSTRNADTPTPRVPVPAPSPSYSTPPARPRTPRREIVLDALDEATLRAERADAAGWLATP
ncbi:MAG TPA: hypothetical protein VFL99_12575, partial [Segeticoccus sp.]|uniref:hypothetical protein n=1 Tax=Segeticoccus sp. TaxID=2706531 RepID=UPI002D810364